jgi:hypothetical protein
MVALLSGDDEFQYWAFVPIRVAVVAIESRKK